MIAPGKHRVVIKPNAPQSKIIGYDAERGAYRIAVSEPAEHDKANKELVRFLTKELGCTVRLLHGLRSREKVIEILPKKS
ncbi:DUF167 domain-containing protein [Candidatus Woesearchaeota archaeon]|nr:DUF167 domain-containing protein [Candidatus Woesearchaeota archaeon]